MVVTVKSGLNGNLMEYTFDSESDSDSHIEDGLTERMEKIRKILHHYMLKWTCCKFHVVCNADFQV